MRGVSASNSAWKSCGIVISHEKPCFLFVNKVCKVAIVTCLSEARFGRVARVSPYVRLPCVSKDMGWVNNNRTPVDHKIVNAHQRAVVSTILLGLWVYVAPYKPSGFVGIPVVVGWGLPALLPARRIRFGRERERLLARATLREAAC